MKNIIRAFVVVLVLTGAAASARTSAPATAKTIAASVQSNLLPIPSCDPNDSAPCTLK
jgi:hypothetical protein